LRVGLIGTSGYVRGAHVPNLQAIPDVAITALYNRGEKNLNAALELFGDDAPAVYRDWQALLDEGPVDAVVISLPPDMNEASCTAALKAGKHVFLEKPIAHTLESARNVLRAAQESGRVVQMGFELRHGGMYRKLKEILDAGQLGTLHQIHLLSISGVLWAYRKGTWVTELARSGGVMNTWATHPIDLFNDMAGAAPVRATSVGDTRVVLDQPNIDMGFMTVEYANGVFAGLTYNRFSDNGTDWDFTCIGDQGRAEAHLKASQVDVFMNGESDHTSHKVPTRGASLDGCLQQLECFARCIRDGGPPPTDARAGFRATAVALALREAQTSGRPVEITIDESAGE
jgi:predicted dehydrogenase